MRRKSEKDGWLTVQFYVQNWDGKSIYTNLSLSVVLLKLTGQRDGISPEQYGRDLFFPSPDLLYPSL